MMTEKEKEDLTNVAFPGTFPESDHNSGAAGVMRKNCIGCKYLSILSEMGYRYCLNKNKVSTTSNVIENVNIRQWFCPLN